MHKCWCSGISGLIITGTSPANNTQSIFSKTDLVGQCIVCKSRSSWLNVACTKIVSCYTQEVPLGFSLGIGMKEALLLWLFISTSILGFKYLGNLYSFLQCLFQVSLLDFIGHDFGQYEITYTWKGQCVSYFSRRKSTKTERSWLYFKWQVSQNINSLNEM